MIEKEDKPILERLQDDISNFKEYGEILLCGDFNARVGLENDFIFGDENHYNPAYQSYQVDNNKSRKSLDSHIDARGKRLLEMCSGHSLRILNGRLCGDTFGKFTCHTTHGSSVVDYTIMSESLLTKTLYFKVENFIPSLSDAHCQLKWCISCAGDFSTKNPDKPLLKFPKQFIWDETSCKKFQDTLASPQFITRINDFNNSNIEDSQESIDATCGKLENIILDAAKCCLRLPKPSTKKKVAHKKWFDSDLRSMRSQLFRRGNQLSNDPFNTVLRNSFFKLYRLYNKTRKYKMKSFKKDIIKKLDNLHNNDPKQYWALVNSLKENKKTIPPVEPDKFLEHFKNLNSLPSKYEDRVKALKILLKKLEHDSSNFNEMDFKISEKELESAIKKLKNNKAGGLQLITNDMLKAGQNALLPSLRMLFNKILVYGKYPTNWIKGYISPIPKSGDPNKPENYRGIAVTGSLSKLINSIFNKRLDNFLEKQNFYNPYQIGFSRDSRTADHIFVLKALLDKYFSKNKKVYACFVDFQKAFDTVIHTAIYIKLLKANVGGLFYNLLKNMYDKSLLSIKVGNELTENFSSSVGVRQGDVLSPNLFKIFINDLPDYLSETGDSIFLNDLQIDCLMYADDVILISQSASGLQNKIDKLQKFCNDWCLNININKTKVLIFNKGGKFLNQNFILNGTSLECVNSIKYLGIMLTCSGSFTGAQQELLKKGNKALWKLKADLVSLQPSIKTLCHVFDHTIKPILLYGSEIWGCFINMKHKSDIICDFSKLTSVFQADKLNIHFSKYILGVNKYSSNFAVMSELGRLPLTIDIFKNTIKYWARIEKSNNLLLKNAYLEIVQLHNSGLHTWYSYILHIMKILDINTSMSELSKLKPHTLAKKLKTYCFDLFIKTWAKTREKLIIDNGKLRTYLKFKYSFECEKYLTFIEDFQKRKIYTKFRISNHKLKVELGRYLKPYLPFEERICEKCFSDDIEDEIHFLLQCPNYSQKRKSLLNSINKDCPAFNNLNYVNKFIWLMTMENDNIIRKVSEFLYENLPT